MSQIIHQLSCIYIYNICICFRKEFCARSKVRIPSMAWTVMNV